MIDGTLFLFKTEHSTSSRLSLCASTTFQESSTTHTHTHTPRASNQPPEAGGKRHRKCLYMSSRCHKNMNPARILGPWSPFRLKASTSCPFATVDRQDRRQEILRIASYSSALKRNGSAGCFPRRQEPPCILEEAE